MDLSLDLRSLAALLFDKTASSPANQVVELAELDDLAPREVLCCARCKTRITTLAVRLSVAGAHAHTFTNPGGITFRIGCFSRVWSCTPVGPSSSEYTWFAGYSWRVIGCSTCGEHLGWSYSRADDRFYGLILARLVEAEDPRGA